MKKGLKVMLEVFLLLTGVLVVLVFLAFSARSEIVPDIYVSAESGKTALAVRGGYEWNSFSESVIADSVAPEDYIYENNNVLLVTPGETMIFKNSENPLNQYKFYQLEMKYYNDSNIEKIVPSVENSKAYADLKYLEVEAPKEEGTYVYHFRFSYYNKGEVSYGLKVVVSSEPNYEIDDLMKYRNTSLRDMTSIQEILNLLPYSEYQEGMIIRINSNPSELQINYKKLAIEKSDLENNTIALFTLIPELELISYHMENEKSVYTRYEIENQIGRNLIDYANDMELWKSEILFKEKILDEVTTRNEIYETILKDILTERGSGDNEILIIDLESLAEQKLLELSSVDCQEILETASEYAKVVYDMSKEEYDKLHSRELMIGVLNIKNCVNIIEIESGDREGILSNISGDILSDELDKDEIEKENLTSGNFREEIIEGKYICTMFIMENDRKAQVKYEVYFLEDRWFVKRI